MNKTLEYMAFELPVVAFDLHETRVSAGGAAVYAEPNRVDEYARSIVELIDDNDRRGRMGAVGRGRIEAGAGLGSSADEVRRRVRRAPAAGGTPPVERRRCSPQVADLVCGIAGTYQWPDGESLAGTMADLLAHRGPDGHGLYNHQTPRVAAALAHRRLSIIDLSDAGSQPFVKDGLRSRYNGELYNYRELRAKLVRPGVRFRSKF